MAGEDKVETIRGTITLHDGTTSTFLISAGYGWSQGGASTERLGRTVDVIDAIQNTLLEQWMLYDENDPQDNDELALDPGSTWVYQSTQQDQGPYGYPERSGEVVVVVRRLDDADRDPEVGDMYEVTFADGQAIHVFREELTA